MTMTNLLSVQPHELNKLTPEAAVHLFARLLWNTASKLSLPLNTIDIPFNIYAPDGGIDAHIHTSMAIPEGDLIVPGGSWYQIKSGPFSATNSSEIKELLCLKDGKLKPKVKACLDTDGTFFAVLFMADPTDTTHPTNAQEAILNYIKKYHSEYKHPKVRILK